MAHFILGAEDFIIPVLRMLKCWLRLYRESCRVKSSETIFNPSMQLPSSANLPVPWCCTQYSTLFLSTQALSSSEDITTTFTAHRWTGCLLFPEHERKKSGLPVLLFPLSVSSFLLPTCLDSRNVVLIISMYMFIGLLTPCVATHWRQHRPARLHTNVLLACHWYLFSASPHSY